ncbi:MAG TPA: hypothetical protein PKD00_01325 [Burkholderiales bacterium]|nr:hypothetical protein [Burkholderiales bacterium]
MTIQEELQIYQRALSNYQVLNDLNKFGFCHYFDHAENICVYGDLFEERLPILYSFNSFKNKNCDNTYWFVRGDIKSRAELLRKAIKKCLELINNKVINPYYVTDKIHNLLKEKGLITHEKNDKYELWFVIKLLRLNNVIIYPVLRFNSDFPNIVKGWSCVINIMDNDQVTMSVGGKFAQKIYKTSEEAEIAGIKHSLKYYI